MPRSPAQQWFSGCVRFAAAQGIPTGQRVGNPSLGTTPKAVVLLHATCCNAAERALSLSLLLPLRRCSSVLAALSHAHSLPVAPSAAHARFKSQSEPSVPVGVCPRPHHAPVGSQGEREPVDTQNSLVATLLSKNVQVHTPQFATWQSVRVGCKTRCDL